MDRGRGDKLFCIGRQKIRLEESSRYAKPRWIPVLDNQYKLKKMNRAKVLIQITTNVKPPAPELMTEIEKNMVQWETLKETLDTGDLILFSKHGWQQSLMESKAKMQWSHIGMVINIPQYHFLLLWELCFESDSSKNVQTFSFEDFPLYLNSVYKDKSLTKSGTETLQNSKEEKKEMKKEKEKKEIKKAK